MWRKSCICFCCSVYDAIVDRTQAVARNSQDWEAIATLLLASPRMLEEWKARTRELCDGSGMWWVSWWARRFSTVLRLSGQSILFLPRHLLCLPHLMSVELHFAATHRTMHLLGAQTKFLLP